jgi:hypothetical protein
MSDHKVNLQKLITCLRATNKHLGIQKHCIIKTDVTNFTIRKYSIN